MTPVLLALIPVILSIAAGYGFRRYGGIPQGSWQHLSYLTYYLFVPALEIKVLANKPFDDLPWLALITSVAALLLLVTACLLIWQRWLRPVQAPTFTSLYQGGVRFNTFIALVLAAQLYGEEGVAAVAVIAAIMILLINILCIGIFSIYIGSDRIKLQTIAYDLISNPLLVGCLIGLGLNFSGVGLSGPVDLFFQLMGNAALPLGLMAVGAGLQLDRLSGNWEVVCTASLRQLLLKPLLAVIAVGLWGLQGLIATALILCFTVPTAPSAYVLSLQKGGDSQTMAAIITVQTLLSALSIPLIVGMI